jgi:hypothetical protein
MPATVSLLHRRKLGNAYMNVADVTFGSSYPTGGESITALQLGLTTIDFVLPSPAGGYIFEFDHTNKKLKAFTPTKAASAHTHTNTLATTGKDIILTHTGADIKGSANTDGENADMDAEPTNGHAVAAYAAVAEAAWTRGTITIPDMGRNVAIVVQNDSGGSLNLYEGVSTFTVTGTWRGAAQTEEITFTSTAENKAVANGKWRAKYGVKPFDTVTNITVDNVPDNDLKIGAGLGSKIGLPTDLATPAEADVTKITKNAANLATTSIVDTTNMTINLGALADGDDFEIVYLGVDALTGVTITNVAGGAISASAASEVANATNLSAVTARVIAIGY